MEGPRVSGPWLVFRGGNAICIYRPLIYRRRICFFLPCGTMSHTILTIRRSRGGVLGVGFYHNGGDRVDPSPRDQRLQHVRKY